MQQPLKRVLIEDISGQIETTTASEDSSEVRPPVAVEPVEHNTHEHVCRGSQQSSEAMLQSSGQEGMVNASSVPADEEDRGCSASVSPAVLCSATATVDHVENSPTVLTDSEASSELPPLPQTTFEFQSHWKQLRTSRPQLVAYFQVKHIIVHVVAIVMIIIYIFSINLSFLVKTYYYSYSTHCSIIHVATIYHCSSFLEVSTLLLPSPATTVP